MPGTSDTTTATLATEHDHTNTRHTLPFMIDVPCLLSLFFQYDHSALSPHILVQTYISNGNVSRRLRIRIVPCIVYTPIVCIAQVRI